MADDDQEAARELEEFIHALSHDLRAPVRALLGFSQALAEDCGERLDDGCRDHLGYVVEAAGRLSGMIDALLRLSRLGSQGMELRPVSVSEVAADAARPLLAAAARRPDLRIAPDIWARADPVLLRVVLDHLLENAVKFTSRHAAASIEV